jgi:tetratricopeptide (TPR) repeat protein
MLSVDGRYNDSNAVLRIGTFVSNDPMFYVIQGNNYSEMGVSQDAENAYQKAFSIMPNRLYPLYQLMLLYEKEGNSEKMSKMAQQVIAFNEKVASPAINEMKKKANVIVNHNNLIKKQ